jgi:hypothetical protein
MKKWFSKRSFFFGIDFLRPPCRNGEEVMKRKALKNGKKDKSNAGFEPIT